MKNTSKKAYQKLAVTYGVLMGLFSILLSVILYTMGSIIEKPLWSTIVITFVGFGITFYAIRQYREQLEGYISLGQAMKMGVAVAFIGGAIAALSNYVFMTYIEPGMVAEMIELGRQQMEESGNNLTDEQIEMSLEMSRKFMQPWIMVAMGVISSVFMGVIYSLVSGLVLQKKKPIA